MRLYEFKNLRKLVVDSSESIAAFKKVGMAFIVRLFGAFSVFIMNIFLARKLGVDEAGLFFLTFTIISIASVVSRVGLDNIVLRNISIFYQKNDHKLLERYYISSLFTSLVFSSFFLVLVYFFSDKISIYIFNKNNLSDVLKYGSFAFVGVAITQLHGFFFLGVSRVVSAGIFSNIIIPFVFMIVLIIFEDLTAKSAALIFSISSLSCFFVAIFAFCYTQKISFFRSCLKAFLEVKIIVKEMPEFFSGISSMFFIQLMIIVESYYSVIIVGVLRPSSDVAIFSSALRTGILTSFILVAVNAIVAPKFSVFYKNKEFYNLKKTAIFASRVTCFLATPTLVFIVVFSKYIMSLYGEDFVSGWICLVIISLGQFINVLTGSVGYLLQMTGHEKVLRNNMLWSLIFIIVFCPIAVTYYGIIGASLVTALSVAFQNILSAYKVNRLLGINTIKAIVPYKN